MYAVKAEVDLSASTVMINCALLVTGPGGQLAGFCSRGAKDEARNGSPAAEGQLENRCAFVPSFLLPFLAYLSVTLSQSGHSASGNKTRAFLTLFHHQHQHMLEQIRGSRWHAMHKCAVHCSLAVV